MPKFNLVFRETRTRHHDIEVEVEADCESLAAERAEAAYQAGLYDTALEEASGETASCETAVGLYRADGKLEWLT